MSRETHSLEKEEEKAKQSAAAETRSPLQSSEEDLKSKEDLERKEEPERKEKEEESSAEKEGKPLTLKPNDSSEDEDGKKSEEDKESTDDDQEEDNVEVTVVPQRKQKKGYRNLMLNEREMDLPPPLPSSLKKRRRKGMPMGRREPIEGEEEEGMLPEEKIKVNILIYDVGRRFFQFFVPEHHKERKRRDRPQGQSLE